MGAGAAARLAVDLLPASIGARLICMRTEGHCQAGAISPWVSLRFGSSCRARMAAANLIFNLLGGGIDPG